MLLLLALTLGNAEASEDLRAGMVTGGITLGTELGGAVVLGAVGLGVGYAMCRGGNGPECWLPLLGVGIGASAGFVAGGICGAALGARVAGRDPRRAAIGAGIAFAAGGAMYGIGTAAGIWPMASAGAVVVVAGMPLAAGWAAASENPPMMVSLDLGSPANWADGPERVGLRVGMAF